MDKEKTVIPPSITEITLKHADQLAEITTMLASDLEGKLNAVLLPSIKHNEENKPVEKEEYPPLFNALRNKLNKIGKSLAEIQSVIKRVRL